MEAGRSVRRELYVSKAQEELGSLAERGVITAGNAFSSVLFVKGELREKLPYDELLPALLRYVDAL